MVFADNSSGQAWGVSAMTLKPACSAAPSLDDLLTNEANTVSLNRFYRAGGVGIARASTECRFAYDSSNLLVVFRCAESDMAFPAVHRNSNWYALLDSFADQDSFFPDKVDLFIRPDLAKPYYYQFAVTLDGLKFGCIQKDDGDAKIQKVTAFDAGVRKEANEWLVYLRIPWNSIGGKPANDFGLLPVRTRWRDGEVSSPVAFDFIERPPTDLFIETHFSGGPTVGVYPETLCRLPSGALHLQRPALLSYPDAETVRAIWQMQQSLSEPTSEYNFSRRLYLTQRWTDLMTLEGFNFRVGRGSIVEKDLSLFLVRETVNRALQEKNAPAAYQSLDAYLHQLDAVSRKWFADGSPGDVADWESVSKMESWEIKGNVLLLHCLAGSHPVNLRLSLPKTGGVRICGDDEGYFKPDELLPIYITSLNSFAVLSKEGNINIEANPFAISFSDTAGNPVTQIGQNNLAFRFNPDGKIAAIDFKNHLDTNEVIYGFGERYDHFNENGHVLTLWGMDDWFGNNVGLMNETYKPIALFHSSRGYTIFDNSTYRLRADIGGTDPHQYRLTQQGPIFDYYLWLGPPEHAINSYTSLTGKPVLPPVWAFEPWMGRTGRGWNAPSHNPVAEEEHVTERFAQLDIPHSGIYAEGSSAESPALNQFMAARGIKVFSWFWPVVSASEQAKLLPGLNTNDLPVLNAKDEEKPGSQLGYVDFTNPNALELMRQWWKKRLTVGVAGSMIDFGDRVPENAVFYNGKRGDEMHNFYAYDYHRTISEVFREKHGDDFILFGRAAAPGDQRWVAHFAGDHPSNFAGLQSVLTGALNLCSCGFSIWGSDMGGFLGWPEPAVYMRWNQFGCFSPLMRNHGRTPREPWNYGNAAVANYKYFAWVRENLLDYIYNAAADSHETGIPIMRSMAVAFPEETSASAMNDQYMFGPDLLVAPVVTEDNIKNIFIPRGQWTSLWTGETISGPTNVTTNVPLDSIPVYLKPGAVVPVRLNSSLQFGQSLTPGSFNALIVTPPDKEERANFQFNIMPTWPRQAVRTAHASVVLQPQTNGFTVTLNDFEKNYLLVYGVSSVSSVKVNGLDLSEENEQEFAGMSSGWEADPKQNRVVIRLPTSKVLRSLREQIEIKFR